MVVGFWYQSLPHANARDHLLASGPSPAAYPWARQADGSTTDPGGFPERQCTSYVAWYLTSHGVPFAWHTRGPRGVGTFDAAGEWDAAAAVAGFPVSTVAAVGSIAQWRAEERSPRSPVSSYYVNDYYPFLGDLDLRASEEGHVAVVVGVLPDGSVLAAEYDGNDRLCHLVRTRAPRYLYIGVPKADGPLTRRDSHRR